jgi:hypothetical protein
MSYFDIDEKRQQKEMEKEEHHKFMKSWWEHLKNRLGFFREWNSYDDWVSKNDPQKPKTEPETERKPETEPETGVKTEPEEGNQKLKRSMSEKDKSDFKQIFNE